MHRFFELFGHDRKILLVVLHLSPTNTYEIAHCETAIAQEAGADGVFLIDMHGYLVGDELVRLCDEIATQFPGFFVGINDLDASDPSETIRRVAGTKIAAVWSDRTGNRDAIEAARAETGWRGPLFAGVIFKGQRDLFTPDSKIPEVVQAALPYVEVLTTSGPGTGMPADNRRLKLIREAAGDDVAIALFSGVDADNAKGNLEYVDVIGAASSLIDKDDRLIPEKVAELANTVHNHQA